MFQGIGIQFGRPKTGELAEAMRARVMPESCLLRVLTSTFCRHILGTREDKSPYVIQGVKPGFPAERSGLIALGDVLHAVAHVLLVHACIFLLCVFPSVGRVSFDGGLCPVQHMWNGAANEIVSVPFLLHDIHCCYRLMANL